VLAFLVAAGVLQVMPLEDDQCLPRERAGQRGTAWLEEAGELADDRL
jgi:hypothetical protein